MYSIKNISALPIFSKNPALQSLFKPDRTFRARVLEGFGKNALIDINGIEMEVKTAVPLKGGESLVLKVVESSSKELKFKLVGIDVPKKALLPPGQQMGRGEIIQELSTLYPRLSELFDLLRGIPDKRDYALMLKEFFGRSLKELKEGSFVSLKRVRAVLEEIKKSEPASAELVQDILNSVNHYLIIGSIAGVLVTFLPVEPEGLKENRVLVKRVERDIYFCKVHLKFADIGIVSVSLILQSGFLSVYLFVEDGEFKNILMEDKDELLRSFGTKVAVTISIFDYHNSGNEEDFIFEDGFVDIKI